ncbi:hypothetical protein LIX27_02195 [Leptospira borgpetersenii]|uniref:hypothetical protein n=1 Tax=Leptospira borgpetersenii TaxID=174 RepID=UPI00034B78BC|nr:hypothetical protein [Leptospira borgpetersenii]UVD76732.1 hypothetical protein LIX27_02195 [Leptospira borgpetersenii]
MKFASDSPKLSLRIHVKLRLKFPYIPETDFQDLMKDQNGFKTSCHTKARTGAYSYGKAL